MAAMTMDTDFQSKTGRGTDRNMTTWLTDHQDKGSNDPCSMCNMSDVSFTVSVQDGSMTVHHSALPQIPTVPDMLGCAEAAGEGRGGEGRVCAWPSTDSSCLEKNSIT